MEGAKVELERYTAEEYEKESIKITRHNGDHFDSTSYSLSWIQILFIALENMCKSNLKIVIPAK